MKNIITLLVVLGIFIVTPAMAQNKFGAGIVLGEPTGFTVKYDLGNQRAIDGALSFFGYSNLYIHSTYLKLMPKFFNIERHPVSWYFGIGGRILSHRNYHWHGKTYYDHGNDTHLAVRAPIGLSLNFANSDFELFTELALYMDIIPVTEMYIYMALGGRYYF